MTIVNAVAADHKALVCRQTAVDAAQAPVRHVGCGTLNQFATRAAGIFSSHQQA